ncbi:conserved hypothetical protein [Burkholderiales bacterium 8X]|nr:conserved hypothetical protein [Burkholderiales bacterium 8X]
MKINSPNDAALAAVNAAAVKAERGATTAAPANGRVQDAGAGTAVTMSTAARALDSTSAGSGIDEKKVAAMREAIANGTFTVNAGAIADKLLSNAQEFLSRARS